MDAMQEIKAVIQRRGIVDIPGDNECAHDVISKRLKAHEDDAIAWVAGISTMAASIPILNPEVASDVREALRFQYPQAYGPLSDEQLIETIASKTPEQLSGLLSGAKGKLLEMKVVDNLNSGDSIGGFLLEPGQTAELAKSATEPGYDIIVRSGDGSISELLSAKCSSDLSVVADALETYPQYQIVGSSELAGEFEGVIDSEIADTEISEYVRSALENAEDVGGVLDTIGDFLPGLPILFVVGRHGVPILMGKSTLEKSMKGIVPELVEAGFFVAIGIGLSSTGVGISAIPIMLGLRWGWRTFKERNFAITILTTGRTQLEPIVLLMEKRVAEAV